MEEGYQAAGGQTSERGETAQRLVCLSCLALLKLEMREEEGKRRRGAESLARKGWMSRWTRVWPARDWPPLIEHKKGRGGRCDSRKAEKLDFDSRHTGLTSGVIGRLAMEHRRDEEEDATAVEMKSFSSTAGVRVYPCVIGRLMRNHGGEDGRWESH
jgi:hypothetical protein